MSSIFQLDLNQIQHWLQTNNKYLKVYIDVDMIMTETMRSHSVIFYGKVWPVLETPWCDSGSLPDLAIWVATLKYW